MRHQFLCEAVPTEPKGTGRRALLDGGERSSPESNEACSFARSYWAKSMSRMVESMQGKLITVVAKLPIL